MYGASVFNTDGTLVYRNEADLRDGLAFIANAAGWKWSTETTIPNWGRIDLLLTFPQTLLVELKVSLQTPREIRRAAQQAHGYATQLNLYGAYIVAPRAAMNTDLASELCARFPVVPDTLEGLMAYLRRFGSEELAMQRREIYRHHQDLFERNTWHALAVA